MHTNREWLSVQWSYVRYKHLIELGSLTKITQICSTKKSITLNLTGTTKNEKETLFFWRQTELRRFAFDLSSLKHFWCKNKMWPSEEWFHCKIIWCDSFQCFELTANVSIAQEKEKKRICLEIVQFKRMSEQSTKCILYLSNEILIRRPKRKVLPTK